MKMYMKVQNGKPNNIPQPCPHNATHPSTGKKVTGLHLLSDKQKREYGYYPVLDDKPDGVVKSSSYVVEDISVRKQYVMFTDVELTDQQWDNFRENRSQLLPHLNWTQMELSVSGLTLEQRTEMTEFIQRLIDAPECCATPMEANELFTTCPQWFTELQSGWISTLLCDGMTDIN